MFAKRGYLNENSEKCKKALLFNLFKNFTKNIYLKKITNKILFLPDKSKTDFFAPLEFQKEKR